MTPESTAGPAAPAPVAGGGAARWKRRGLKALVFTLGLLLQLFPHPGRALAEFRTLRDPQARIDPDDPAIARLSEEVDRALPGGLSRPEQVAWIERFVEDRIPYEHDWITWWNVDYWPTPTETLEAGREDCDGIAIVTASLLRRRGFRVRLEASYQHVWVEVEGDRILGAGETRWDGETLTAPSLREIAAWVRYAAREFPAWRWVLMAAWAAAVVLWKPRKSGASA